MKYVIFLIDGMADEPLTELGGKTVLESAKKPVMDALASHAQFGTFLTLPDGFPTSSDVANMSVLGWDLARSYTGRGAIESYGMGIPLEEDTIAFRMNLITVKEGILEDYSAGHISNEEASILIDFLKKELEDDFVKIQKGVSYRHILYLKGKDFYPDIHYEKPDSSHGLAWEDLLPKAKIPEAEKTASLLRDLICRSQELLADHPVNRERIYRGENPANLIWPWSGGKKPDMPSFQELFGKKGAIISAVDVILGLGLLGKMDSLRPSGATGYIDTNYENKAKAAIELLKKNDFVYVHVEAADECAHLGDLEGKKKVIEDCDRRLIGTFLSMYKKNFSDGLRVMVLPDHPVPIRLRKHTRDRVPFMLSGDGILADPNIREYGESACVRGKYSGLKGRELIDLLFAEKIG